MNARLRGWVEEWDWRTLARLIVWLAIANTAANRTGVHFASPGAILEAFVLGWLLTFGLLAWLQIWIVVLAVRLYFLLDDWTYALSEWIVRPISGRAPFAVNFLAALAVQLGLVRGGLAYWHAAHLGPRVLALLESGFRLVLGVV
jgi:hypothetical protein